jgi:hypothetical protein
MTSVRPDRNKQRSRGRTTAVGVALVAMVVINPQSGRAQDATFRPPDAEAKIAALRAAGSRLAPLYVLGDVNEDGRVDEKDYELIRNIIRTKKLRPSADASCPAAADLDRDGSITPRDLTLMTQWVKTGRMMTPALSFQSLLPCDFKQFFAAASSYSAAPGSKLNVRFLGDGLDSSNSAVKVEAGDAQAESAADRRGYVISVRETARIDDHVTLRITMPQSRSYLYTVSVRAQR